MSNASADVTKGNAAAARLNSFIEWSSVAKMRLVMKCGKWACVLAGAPCIAMIRAHMPCTASVPGNNGKNTDGSAHTMKNLLLG